MKKSELMREKIKKFRQNFKNLDESGPIMKYEKTKKGKNKRKGKKKVKGKNKRKFKKKVKGENNKNGKKQRTYKKKKHRARGRQRNKIKGRYYTEGGKYKANKKFDDWAEELDLMWGKVSERPIPCVRDLLQLYFLLLAVMKSSHAR